MLDDLIASLAAFVVSWARSICLYADSPDGSELRAMAMQRRRMIKTSLLELMLMSGDDEAERARFVQVISARVLELVDAAPPSPSRMFWMEVLYTGSWPSTPPTMRVTHLGPCPGCGRSVKDCNAMVAVTVECVDRREADQWRK